MYLFNIKVWKIYIYKKAAPKIVSKSLDGLSEFWTDSVFLCTMKPAQISTKNL